VKKVLGAILLVVFLGVIVLPLIIARLDQPPERQYSFAKPESSRNREVSFENPQAKIQLGGMLFLPEGVGPYPAAVIIHGSGTSRRENGWYLTLVHHLQDAGIAVLLPDKRGSVKSEGDWRTASMEELAGDSVAAIEFLKGEYPEKISNIGAVGLSQGGWITPIVPGLTDRVDYLVSVVSSTIPAHEVLIYEEIHNLREMGFLPGLSNLIAYLSAYVLINFSQKDFWDAVGNFDPMIYWAEVTIPALAIFGREDKNVPSEKSAALLQSLNHSNIEVMVFEGSGHALQDPPTLGNDYFRKDALQAISDFIHASAGPAD
jgi:dipeptidyl aminopeptidase/acylaminoacyl peptidase